MRCRFYIFSNPCALECFLPQFIPVQQIHLHQEHTKFNSSSSWPDTSQYAVQTHYRAYQGKTIDTKLFFVHPHSSSAAAQLQFSVFDALAGWRMSTSYRCPHHPGLQICLLPSLLPARLEIHQHCADPLQRSTKSIHERCLPRQESRLCAG